MEPLMALVIARENVTIAYARAEDAVRWETRRLEDTDVSMGRLDAAQRRYARLADILASLNEALHEAI